jgi:hypothetical protein
MNIPRITNKNERKLRRVSPHLPESRAPDQTLQKQVEILVKSKNCWITRKILDLRSKNMFAMEKGGENRKQVITTNQIETKELNN